MHFFQRYYIHSLSSDSFRILYSPSLVATNVPALIVASLVLLVIFVLMFFQASWSSKGVFPIAVIDVILLINKLRFFVVALFASNAPETSAEKQ